MLIDDGHDFWLALDRSGVNECIEYDVECDETEDDDDKLLL